MAVAQASAADLVGPKTAPGCSGSSARPTASGSSSVLPSADWPRSAGPAFRSSSPPRSPVPTPSWPSGASPRPGSARRTSTRPVVNRERATISVRGALGTIAVPAVVTVLLVASFSAFEATFALFGQRRLGFGEGTVGAVFALVGVVSALVQGGLVHPLAARVGDAACLRVGLVAEALGLVLVPTVHTRVDLVLPLALVTVGQSLCTPALGALVAAKVSGRDYGAVLGVQQGLSSLARIVGPALGGLVFAVVGVGAPFVGGGLVVSAALVYSLAMRTSIRSSPQMVAEPPGIGYR